MPATTRPPTLPPAFAAPAVTTTAGTEVEVEDVLVVVVVQEETTDPGATAVVVGQVVADSVSSGHSAEAVYADGVVHTPEADSELQPACAADSSPAMGTRTRKSLIFEANVAVSAKVVSMRVNEWCEKSTELQGLPLSFDFIATQ